ncbi:MAG: PEP-CTERM sorting domain-containing protein, partial [Planctomycetales bacterium]|nr:PEP-CTERM sorting domain-containing protein [Planctomycetales bacterium]
SVNVSAVPEPSSWVLLSLITGLVVSRNGVKRLFARWFSK